MIDTAIDWLLATCKANGIFAGLGGDKDPKRQARFLQLGGQFVTAHSDLAYLMIAAKERASFLRGAMQNPAAKAAV